MGDCEIKIKESKEKQVAAFSSLSQEIESGQMCGIKTFKPTGSEETCIDFGAEMKAVAYKKKEAELSAKRDTTEIYGARSSGALDFGSNDCYGQLDWNKKDSDKTFFVEKQYAKNLDFSPIAPLSPVASRFFDRVDTNGDGRMTVHEMNSALYGDALNVKEKSMLEVIKKNKDLIDNGRDGISMRDIKEFDSKVIQYQKDLTMARKFAPELAEFARELHQRGKLADQNHDGRFSRDELISFYKECKEEFTLNPTEQGKRELAALNWGIANYDRYSLMTGRPGGGQINAEFLQAHLLQEMDRQMSPSERQYLLSVSDRLRVQRYQTSL